MNKAKVLNEVKSLLTEVEGNDLVTTLFKDEFKGRVESSVEAMLSETFDKIERIAKSVDALYDTYNIQRHITNEFPSKEETKAQLKQQVINHAVQYLKDHL